VQKVNLIHTAGFHLRNILKVKIRETNENQVARDLGRGGDVKVKGE
jgi:hypothetical protein